MYTFHQTTLEDKEWMLPILKESSTLSSSATFGSAFVWQSEYKIEVCRYKDFLLSAYLYQPGVMNFTYPVGKGDVKEAVEFVFTTAKERGLKPAVTCMGKYQAKEMERLYPSAFKTENKRDIAEYIYLADDLAYLRGRKFHSKRNHIKNFKENYNWSYEPITKSNIDDAFSVAKQWCVEHGCESGDEYAGERCALKKTFAHFEALKMRGAIVYVDKKPIAMAIGEEVSPDCFVVHFEKAVGEIQGGFAAINNLFALELAQQYTFINREEDLGIEGMRKAKLSYKPIILLEKIVFS